MKINRRTLLGVSTAAMFWPRFATAHDAEYSEYFSLIHDGRWFRGDTSTFDLDIAVVPQSTQLVEVLARAKGMRSSMDTVYRDAVYRGDWSENALPIVQAIKAGAVPVFQGGGIASYYINLRPEHLPSKLFCMEYHPPSGYMWPLGMAAVQTAEVPGHSRVDIPITYRGLMQLILPRKCMERRVTDYTGYSTSVTPVVRLNLPTLQLPEITGGCFAGWPDTLISKPSGNPGISHAAERALSRKTDGRVYLGVVYPFIVNTGGVGA